MMYLTRNVNVDILEPFAKFTKVTMKVRILKEIPRGGTKSMEGIKKKVILIVLIVAIIVIAVIAGGWFGPKVLNRIGRENVITSSRLEKAINLSELSTAEFIYNGIAEKYNDEQNEKVQCYIAYNATVKVGIKMEDVKFEINNDTKKIKPILPEIAINIADVEPSSIQFIPKNPDIELKEVLEICKEDAENEANKSDELYEIAEKNLQSVIEALLSPILRDSEYVFEW